MSVPQHDLRRALSADALADWVDRPTAGPTVELSGGRGRPWSRWTYPELATMIRDLAARLAAADLGPGCRVGVEAETSIDFVIGLFASWYVGATVVPLPVASAFRRSASFVDELHRAVAIADVATVLGYEGRRQVLAGLMLVDVPPARPPLLGLEATEERTLDETAAAAMPAEALIQFTSGSTSSPRGVVVSGNAILANVQSILDWLDVREGDVGSSWLPLYHDMGLIGFVVTPVLAQMGTRLLTPRQLLRDARSWLATFAQGATIGGAPNFALDLIADAVDARSAEYADLDLSRWKALVVGSEVVQATSIDRFCEVLAPLGFDPGAVLPAYGLAEASLAACGRWPGTATRRLIVDRSGEPQPPGTVGPAYRELVSCGTPLRSVDVEVVDAEGHAVEGVVGTIRVGGDAMASGYVGTDEPLAIVVRPDGSRALSTGDAGIVVDGELYVLGRMANMIKVSGRSVWCEDLEAKLRTLTDAPAKLMVATRPLMGRAAVVLAEVPKEPWLAEAAAFMREAASGVDVQLIAARRGSLPFTTSGKPRRGRALALLEAGDLEATGPRP